MENDPFAASTVGDATSYYLFVQPDSNNRFNSSNYQQLLTPPPKVARLYLTATIL
jgi:hypothetical protein